MATLDLPMVVDLIGIYGLKGPYCTLTMTDWFLQALSVIPMGSWGYVARRFTMIRLAAAAAAARRRRKFVSGQLDEKNPFMQNSSVLLVQADEGVSVLVVDRIGDIYRSLPRRADVIVTTVGARHKCQQGSGFEPPIYVDNCYQFFVLIVSRLLFYVLPLPCRGADPDPQQCRPPAAAACGGPLDVRTSARSALRIGDRTPHRAPTALDARLGHARRAPRSRSSCASAALVARLRRACRACRATTQRNRAPMLWRCCYHLRANRCAAWILVIRARCCARWLSSFCPVRAGCETMRDVVRDDDTDGAASRDTACALAARMFFRGGAAGRPPLRRCRDGRFEFF
ncbi:hypothetical protein F511_44933 [Dorcoceras hygrometricum]|uniref:Uncharacterized protein n=1 Tax=Dorcoceras hygrometricum TaxID=472368 RepID=A0A2Z6ZX63_9LAMI|nr:hypothetical protein F511_44933 [Dorcoceras hygrometricum]